MEFFPKKSAQLLLLCERTKIERDVQEQMIENVMDRDRAKIALIVGRCRAIEGK